MRSTSRARRRTWIACIAWVRKWGKGRVFSCLLGHDEAVWDRPDIQKMWLEAVRWVLGLTEGDVTPRPKPTGD